MEPEARATVLHVGRARGLNPSLALRARLVVLVLATALSPAARGQSGLTPAQEARRTPITDVVQRTRDAVVNIAATQVFESTREYSIFDDFFFGPQDGRRRGQTRRFTRTSLGSGFVLHAKGYVVTNAHVIQQAAEQKVIFADKTEYEADRVAIDEKHDLAILRIRSERTFPALPLGRSEDLMIGETVIAIGNPLGYGHTVTSGIVSALDRELPLGEGVTYEHLIQTDASINRGNSGGPLLNIKGELIGINTAIRGDAQNIGFAIPVDALRKLLPDLLSTEHGPTRVAVGIRLGWRNDLRVAAVRGPAAEAGIEPGDELVAVDGRKISQDVDFYIHVLGLQPGGRMALDLRREGKTLRKEVVAQAVPIPDGAALLREKFGLIVRLITPEEAREYQIKAGLMVTGVVPGSPAAEVGFRRGMIVDQVGQYFPSDLAELGLVLEKVQRGEKVAFRLWTIGRDYMKAYAVSLVAQQ